MSCKEGEILRLHRVALGEAVAFRRSVIILDLRWVRVKESATEVAGNLEWASPKTHEARTVIVPRFLAVRLADHVEGMAAGYLVFTAPQCGPLRTSNFCRDSRRARRSRMPEGLLVHDLRDTPASVGDLGRGVYQGRAADVGPRLDEDDA